MKKQKLCTLIQTGKEGKKVTPATLKSVIGGGRVGILDHGLLKN